MRSLALGLLCSILVGCALQPDVSPSLEPAPSVMLAAPPPLFVTQNLANGTRMTFVPLTGPQLAAVRIDKATAERTALSIDPASYGTKGAKVFWKSVGCVFLGWYVGPSMPRLGYVPPTHAAYLVQIIGDPVAGWPGINVEAVEVNAETGERGTIYGGGPGPIMGTTCGVPA
jgi:hypothetical protein